MNKIFIILLQKITWKIATIFTIIYIIFFVLINFSNIGVSGLLKITGGENILDFEFGYNKDEAYQILSALGFEGREFYLKNIIPMDFPFPLAYMLFYAGWIALLIKNIYQICKKCPFGNHNKRYKYLLFIPILATLCDFIENIGIITMLNSYPNLQEWSVYMASYAGILKTIFTIGSVGIIVILIFVFIFKKLLIKKRIK